MIYFNNAATTWPKPGVVCEAVDRALREMSSPSRTYSAEGTSTKSFMRKSREDVAGFLGIKDPDRLAFSGGCTYSTNAAIQGIEWEAGDVVLMTSMEHHATSRAVRLMAERCGVRFELIPYREDEPLDLGFVEDRLKRGGVRLVTMTMAANVTGDLMPYEAVSKMTHEHGVMLMLDAAQTVGAVGFSVEALDPDIMVFAGHKGLYGPPGIGGMYVKEGVALRAFAVGGTGHDSGTHEIPMTMPAIFETGTHNAISIAGLAAGVNWLAEIGVDAVRAHEQALTTRFLEGLASIEGIRVYGTRDVAQKTAVVSCTLEGVRPQEGAARLATEHDVASRPGYHCSPMSHETLGTLPGDGTLRFSFGYFNTNEEVDAVIGYVREMMHETAAQA